MLLPIIMILVCVLLGGGTLLFLKFSEKRKKAKSRDKEELAQMTANEFVNVKDIRGSFLYTRDGWAAGVPENISHQHGAVQQE